MKKQLLIIVILAVAFVWGVSLVHAEAKGKQVFCNIEGNSGKFKTQIGGKGTEHEQPVLINGSPVYVQNQNDVTPEMEAFCAALPEVPKPCPAGTTLDSYINGDKQNPDCKGNPTGTTADDPNKGEVKSTTPTPVDDTVYPDFQGK